MSHFINKNLIWPEQKEIGGLCIDNGVNKYEAPTYKKIDR